MNPAEPIRYYESYDDGEDDPADEFLGNEEGYFWRVSPDGTTEGIHEDDHEWHRVPLKWDDMVVNAYEITPDLLPARLLTAPTRS